MKKSSSIKLAVAALSLTSVLAAGAANAVESSAEVGIYFDYATQETSATALTVGIVQPGDAGTIAVATDGTVTPTDVTMLDDSPATQHITTLEGMPGAAVDVTVDLGDADAGISMGTPVCSFNSTSDVDCSSTVATAFDSNGDLVIDLGMTLTLDGNQTPATEPELEYTIDITYQ